MKKSSHVMKIFGVQIHGGRKTHVREQLRAFLASNRPHRVATVNPEMLVAARRNPTFRRILASFELRVPDGFGLRLVSALYFGHFLPERVTGSDLVEMLCELCAHTQHRILFLGGEEGLAQRAAAAMQVQYPGLEIRALSAGKIVKRDEQWHIDVQVVDEIRAFQPAVIAVALGHEKQELWIHDFLPAFPFLRVGVGVGGTFAYLSHDIPRAPGWMQNIGFEWLWRFLLEPARWRRIITAVLIFPILAFFDRLRPISTDEHL